jgi:hypothetical protein
MTNYVDNLKMSPPRGKRLIDPLADDEISGIEAVRCYQATTHAYYLNVNNRYAISYKFILDLSNIRFRSSHMIWQEGETST